MENLIFLLSESWSTVAADQFFSILENGVLIAEATGGTVGEATGRVDTPATDAFFGMFWNMLRFIGATVLVALLAWFVTKKMVSARGLGGRKGKNLSVVESINLGGQAIAQLVKVGDKYLVVGVTKERVTMLAEVDKESIIEIEPPAYNVADTPFGKVLSRFVKPKDGNGDNESDE